MHVEFWIFMYIWVMVSLFFIIRIFYHDQKIPMALNIILLVCTPVILLIIIDIIISKIILYKKENSIMKNFKLKTARAISSIVDRAAIRFINITDMLRGTYEK